MKSKRRILVTGSAGFIGHHLVMALQSLGYKVVGLDSINDYYDPELKYGRLREQGFSRSHINYNSCIISSHTPLHSFIRLDLTDKEGLEELFRRKQFDIVINLAAQAGVLYSKENPMAYVQSNLVGFANLLEVCRRYPVKHLLFASSSSVYGLNQEVPFATSHSTDHPISFYAATKKANEVMAHSYAHLYGIPTTGMRFFTVYGPWGRPDMACFLFAKCITENKPIKLFNQGDMWRDFTFVTDVVGAVIRLIEKKPKSQQEYQNLIAPFRLFNIGNNHPVRLMELVAVLERHLHKKAQLEFLPMQAGDVHKTFADVSDLEKAIRYRPKTRLDEGVRLFVEWFEAYQQKLAFAA
jgi:UDP-glucuronate 4-epimerase